MNLGCAWTNLHWHCLALHVVREGETDAPDGCWFPASLCVYGIKWWMALREWLLVKMGREERMTWSVVDWDKSASGVLLYNSFKIIADVWLGSRYLQWLLRWTWEDRHCGHQFHQQEVSLVTICRGKVLLDTPYEDTKSSMSTEWKPSIELEGPWAGVLNLNLCCTRRLKRRYFFMDSNAFWSGAAVLGHWRLRLQYFNGALCVDCADESQQGRRWWKTWIVFVSSLCHFFFHV